MKQGKLSRFVSPSQREKSKEQYHNDVTHQQGLCGMSSKWKLEGVCLSVTWVVENYCVIKDPCIIMSTPRRKPSVETQAKRDWGRSMFSPMSCKVGPVLHHPPVQQLLLLSECNCRQNQTRIQVLDTSWRCQLISYYSSYSLTLISRSSLNSSISTQNPSVPLLESSQVHSYPSVLSFLLAQDRQRRFIF